MQVPRKNKTFSINVKLNLIAHLNFKKYFEMREELNIKKSPIGFDYFKRYSYWQLDAANFAAPDKKFES